MITICASPMQAIRLGRVGENERQRVAFDVSALLAELPGAAFTVINQGPGDATAYPCPGVSLEDGTLYWPITSAELKQTGRGRCELIVTVGDTVAKSVIYATQVLEALDGSGEAPEPWDSWQTEFAGMVADAQEAASEAAESVEHYPTITDGVWMVWDAQSGAYVSTGVEATGPKGDKGDPGSPGAKGDPGQPGQPGEDGVSPTATVTQTATGATITVTDAEGTTTAEIANGKDGDPGAPGDPGTPGISPTVTVTDITGGHRITITDADGAHSFDVMDGDSADAPVQDVQVNGTSILSNGVANIPRATNVIPGVACFEINNSSNSYGVGFYSSSNNLVVVVAAPSTQIKAGTNAFKPIVPSLLHTAIYYGLAKAAGADMKNVTGETVGVYPEAQKSAIQTMLNGSVAVTGTTPTITALPGIQYVCGEVATLDITLPASGIVDVAFQSGSTPTVLTVTPQTGMTVEWANGFDSTALEADTLYELNIKMVGAKCLGVAGQWS